MTKTNKKVKMNQCLPEDIASMIFLERTVTCYFQKEVLYHLSSSKNFLYGILGKDAEDQSQVGI